MADFRFDAETHTYYLAGEEIPHITGLLQRSGWIDDRWFTEESSERGVQVHRLTADYDLEALDVATCMSRYRGYLLSHVEAMLRMRPEVLEVEHALVSRRYRFGGRPDRIINVYKQRSILEGKSGDPADSHAIQTALQAILDSERSGIPPEMIPRYCIYWKANGRCKLEEHVRRQDFLEARRILRRYAA